MCFVYVNEPNFILSYNLAAVKMCLVYVNEPNFIVSSNLAAVEMCFVYVNEPNFILLCCRDVLRLCERTKFLVNDDVVQKKRGLATLNFQRNEEKNNSFFLKEKKRLKDVRTILIVHERFLNHSLE